MAFDPEAAALAYAKSVLDGLVVTDTLTHGSNEDCPLVANGTWKRCEGHHAPRVSCGVASLTIALQQAWLAGGLGTLDAISRGFMPVPPKLHGSNT